jgi:superfamily II DNA or RNA helicase
MSDVPRQIKTHCFYANATTTMRAKNEFKGGESEDMYERLQRYGTYASPSDRYECIFLAEVAIDNPSLIKKIEKHWLSKFPQIDESSDEEDTRVSGKEFRKFEDFKEFEENILEALKDFNLSQSLHAIFKTSKEISHRLKQYRDAHLPSAPTSSSSGLSMRQYQTEDIQSTLYAFLQEGVKRGYWAIECGLGKTVMAFELISRMEKRKNIFVVPRTALLEQVLRSFLAWKYPKGRLFACSGEALPKDIQGHVTKMKDSSELPVDSKPFILVITYDSLQKLRGYHANFMIFDEAHHLVPSAKKEDTEGYVFGLYDDNIRVDHRLAITATPKDTTISEDGGVSYIGMSHQPHLYGPCLAERNYIFGRDNDYLAPYEVICMKTNPKDIRSQIAWLKSLFQLSSETFQSFLEALTQWEEGRSREMAEYIERDTEKEDTISNDTILWYALIAVQLLQIVSRYGVRRIISYHTTILRAEKFIDIVNTLLQLPQYNRTSLTFSCDSVCSSQSNGINQDIKAKYLAKEGADVRILSNCRTLIEGFDAPSVDCTLFADNKYSPIECCQIVGRGNRKDSSNTGKTHRICIPFIAYEKEDRDSIILRSTTDYKTVRYVVKNVIPSSDTAKTISQTVWVPPIHGRAGGGGGDVDKTEKVWIRPEEHDSHDSVIISSISTEEIAGQTFVAARMWMHDKAKDMGWALTCKVDGDISHKWKRYVETHELPKGIPCDPSKVFKDVGWVNWRDYSGILSPREEWREVNSGEFRRLAEEHGAKMVHMTMSQLHTFVEKAITRRLPDNPRVKWKMGIYDIIGSVKPECVTSIKKLGKFPDGIFMILKKEGIRSVNDFERLWPELHASHSSLPAIPTDIWRDTFWAKYDEYLTD